MNMEKLKKCRICLVENVRMYLIASKNLQEIYEKLTDVPFVTKDSRPMLACFVCCSKLKQCYQLQRKCLEAEELFAQMLNDDYATKPLINQGLLEFCSGFTVSPTENISIIDQCQTDSIAIKEELPAVCEGENDIIEFEPMEEHQIVELEPENLDNSCKDVADIPPLQSKSDLEEDVPLMEFKTEVEEEQEVLTKKRRDRETTSAAVVKEPKLETRRTTLEDAITTKETKKEISDSKVIRTTQEKQTKKPTYKYCIAPNCRNTVRNAPDKVFFLVPRGADIRRKWCKIMKRDMVSPSTCLYCCEDHFDVEEDTDNFMKYKIFNLQEKQKTTLRLKKDATPPDIEIEAQNACDSLLPSKSKLKYMATLENFLQWKINKNVSTFSEQVFLAYFNELVYKYKPSTLWSIYSMLKTTLLQKHGVDIKPYSNLTAFLKRRSVGFIGKKSKVLSPNDVERFLKEAPDSQYLATKVALIFGVNGACRRQELCNITTKDIENHGKLLLVKITHTKNNIPRSFTIHGPFYDIVKKYEALRSTKTTNDRFFQNYQKGKCIAQPIGVNKFGNMPKEIAKFLGLPDADSYTGHSFRRTSATLLADAGADILTLKRHGGWRSNTAAESYIEDSIHNKTNIGAKITQAINLEPAPKKFCLEPQPSTSCAKNDLAPLITTEDQSEHPSTSYIPSSSTFTNTQNSEINEIVNNNINLQTLKMPTKSAVYSII